MNTTRISWTRSVQVLVTVTATGEVVTDKSLVRATLAHLIGKIYRRPIEDEGDGLWLVDLPTEIYAQVEDGGELTLNIHATATTVEIAA